MEEAGANVSPGLPRGSARVSRASLCILRNEWTFRKKHRALHAAIQAREETPHGTHGVARGTRALHARMEIFREVEQDEKAIDRIAAARVADPGNANVLVGRRARWQRGVVCGFSFGFFSFAVPTRTSALPGGGGSPGTGGRVAVLKCEIQNVSVLPGFHPCFKSPH